jgi:hypothetical protein
MIAHGRGDMLSASFIAAGCLAGLMLRFLLVDQTAHAGRGTRAA